MNVFKRLESANLQRIFLILMAAGSALAGLPQTTPQLQPGQSVSRQLAAGESHIYRVESVPGKAWFLAVEQLGIDVTLEVSDPDGNRLFGVDSPLDRRGRESLLLAPQEAGFIFVEVRAREAGAPAERYDIRLDPLPQASDQDRIRLAAERAVTQAGKLYREGSTESRRQALSSFREALTHWRSLRQEREIARTLYCMAVLSRLTNETRQALELSLEVLPLWRALQEPLWEAGTLNEIGLDRWLLGEVQLAQESFREAVEVHRSIGERYGLAAAQANLCLMEFVQGRIQAGVDCSQRALPLLREVQAADLEGAAHINLGRGYDVLGEPETALSHFRQALSLLQATGALGSQAQTLNNMALLSSQMGESQDALALYGQALPIFRRLEDHRWEARVLNNLGLEYDSLGETRRALSYYRQALPLRRQVQDRSGEAATLTNLASAQSRLGEADEALALLNEALKLTQTLQDRRWEAITLSQIGKAQLGAGNPSSAIEPLSRASQLLHEIGDRGQEAAALLQLGLAFAAQGQMGSARDSLTQSLQLTRLVKTPHYQALALYELARVERSQDPQAARAHVEEALKIVESVRTRISSPDLRASYSGMQHRAYRLFIDLLMQADQPQKALEVSQRARARTLAELLHESGAEFHKGIPEELVDRRRSLLRRLNRTDTRFWNISSSDQQGAAQLEERRLSILNQLDLVEAEIRSRNPVHAALVQPQPLAAAQIQELLGQDSLLLSYALGEERSFLWAVTSDAMQSFELPPQSDIEDAARRLHRRLSAFEVSERRAQASEAAEMSRMLLGPVADSLKGQRLIIEADGALHYLPFGALPLPARSQEELVRGIPIPLLEQHEVVYLPSLSALAVQRRALAGRPSAPRRLALLADPVFDAQDPRVKGSSTTPRDPLAAGSPQERGGDWHPSGLERLPATRREAEAIAALAPSGTVMTALDFEASPERLARGELRLYQAVHFATHGLIDTEKPELSGLALSLVDESGRPQSGFLRLHDIYNLRLEADLVVLSACRTALGREIRGEGLIGLTRGFMYAGAPRVVASLWSVQDRATAALMTRFYQALWQQGMTPAAALRSAQLWVRQQRRWRDPYYWSAFILQGEWR